MDRHWYLLHHLEKHVTNKGGFGNYKETENDCVNYNMWHWCPIATHIDTTEISLFDAGVSQEGIDEGHIHCDTLKNLKNDNVQWVFPTQNNSN